MFGIWICFKNHTSDSVEAIRRVIGLESHAAINCSGLGVVMVCTLSRAAIMSSKMMVSFRVWLCMDSHLEGASIRGSSCFCGGCSLMFCPPNS